MGDLLVTGTVGGSGVAIKESDGKTASAGPVWGGGVQLRDSFGWNHSPWSAFLNVGGMAATNSTFSRFAWEATGGAGYTSPTWGTAFRAGYGGAYLRQDKNHFIHGLQAGAEITTSAFSSYFDAGAMVEGLSVFFGDDHFSPQVSVQALLRFNIKRLWQRSHPEVLSSQTDSASDWNKATATIRHLSRLNELFCDHHNYGYGVVYQTISDYLRYAKGVSQLIINDPQFRIRKDIHLLSLNEIYNDIFPQILQQMEVLQDREPVKSGGPVFIIQSRNAVRKLLLDAILNDLRGTAALSRRPFGVPCLSLVYHLLAEGGFVHDLAKGHDFQQMLAEYEHHLHQTGELVAGIETEFRSLIDAGIREKLDDVKAILLCLREGTPCESRWSHLSLPALKGQPVSLPENPTETDQ